MTFQDNCGGCGNFDKCDYEDPHYGLVCPRDTRTAPLAPKPEAKTENDGVDNRVVTRDKLDERLLEVHRIMGHDFYIHLCGVIARHINSVIEYHSHPATLKDKE